MLSCEKLSRNVFSLVAFTAMKFPDNETKMVWLIDPTIDYWKRMPLNIVAVVIVTVCVMFNLSLLFNKIALRCKSNYLKQFMEAFCAPLKVNHRYWVGLLLLVRNVSYITSEFLNANRTPKYSLHVIFTLVVGLLLLKFMYVGLPTLAKFSFTQPLEDDHTTLIDEREASVDQSDLNQPATERECPP